MELQPTNICVCCGGRIEGNKCPYCDTEYDVDSRISAKIDSYFGKIEVNNESYEVYLSDVEVKNFGVDSYRDSEGNLHRQANSKRKFTLIEM